MDKIDLHIHTTASDGKLSPEEVLKLFSSKGYHTISITDHDNLGGWKIAAPIAENYGIDLIPGVEVSTQYRNLDVHILAYYMKETEELIEMLNETRLARANRAEIILDKLWHLWGFELEMTQLEEISGSDDIIGRPHIAQAMLDKGYCNSLQEAFDCYIGDDCPAFHSKLSRSPQEVIGIIRRAGGIPVLAHPGLLRKGGIVREIIAMGIQGLEVYYKKHSKEQIDHYLNIAGNNHLIRTGGSDFHGFQKDFRFLDKSRVPQFCVRELKELKGIAND
ncbi:MAG: PHP domain-containing protein [Candidatus Cloacimonetes bacterium]|nr:PHP domain-containing protein [Candidatus Cloacimonadota bacterium]